MISLTDTEKALDKVLHPFMIKLMKVEIEGNFLNMIKVIHQ